MHPVITASVPVLEPPGWAIAQRGLFDLLDQVWRRFDRDFTGPDGRLTYRRRLSTRDGVDDFYETFFNWPQLHLLGGADDLLAASERHWAGVTRQLTELGMPTTSSSAAMTGSTRARACCCARPAHPGSVPRRAVPAVKGLP